MPKTKPKNHSLIGLRSLGFDDTEIISLISHTCGGYSKTPDKSLIFSKTELIDQKNQVFEFATASFNNDGDLKSIEFAPKYSSETEQNQFLEPIRRWHSGTLGQLVLQRPLFALRPLKGKFVWKNQFQIRPIGNTAKIGKGLDFEAYAMQHEPETHLGPPFPFILEVKANKSDDTKLGYEQGLRILTEFESLLSVLLVHHISSHRILGNKRWTSIWNGAEVSCHLLHGGFNTGEDGLREDFSVTEFNDVPRFSGDDYYNHLFGSDDQIILPQNIDDLLVAFEGLTKTVRRAFLRACYWFSLGIENRHETALSIVAFSSAVECLLPRPNNQQCSNCGKPKGKGPTKLFNEHLEKYSPILPSLESKRQKIYGIRSALVHGSRLEAIDLGWPSPVRQEKEDAFLLELVARRSLVNWLSDPERLDPALPSAAPKK